MLNTNTYHHKNRNRRKINRLKAKLTVGTDRITNIKPLLDKVINHIAQLATLHEEGTTVRKRKIICSIFPEKLIYDEFECLTTRIDEGLRIMFLFYKES